MSAHRTIVSAFLLSLLVHTWASAAAAVPIFEVTASSNPIVGGVVQLLPGDQNVSITLGIVPDSGVASFDLFFAPISGITVPGCTGVDLPRTTAACPEMPEAVALALSNFGEGYDPAVTDPFEIGTAMISVSSSAALGSALVAGITSFIEEVGGIEPVGGQVVATVVPEPGTALLMGLGLAGLGVVRRSRREESKATA